MLAADPLADKEMYSEFPRRYPSDPLGHEMEADARVWQVYRDAATKADNALLEDWNSTLDILLIFVRNN